MMEDRRYPPNLQGLLRFCTERTKSEDAVGVSQSFEPMSEERKKWLKNALETITENDPVKKMIEHLKVILNTDETNDNLNKKECALDELALYCEDIDLANDFYKIGGFDIFPILLNGTHDSLKWRTAQLLANLAQNNPFCQEKIIENGTLLKTLLQKLQCENEPPDVKVKCLYAVSCLTREYQNAQNELIKLDGLKVIIKLLHSNIEKLQIKSLFLINSLCIESNKIKGLLLGMNIIDHLIELLVSEQQNAIHEHATKAINSLAEGNDLVKKTLRDPKYDLKVFVRKRINNLKDDKDQLDEVEDLKLLLRTLD